MEKESKVVSKQKPELERVEPLTADVLKMILGRHRGILIFGCQSVDTAYIRDHNLLITEVTRLWRGLKEIRAHQQDVNLKLALAEKEIARLQAHIKRGGRDFDKSDSRHIEAEIAESLQK